MNFSERLADDSLAVFLLHGVVEAHANPVRNYNRKHIDRARFTAFLEDLAARGRALSMDEVLACCESGEPFPERSYAITFDDGFENNASVAAPVLRRMGIPAAFYVTTGFLELNGMSWIDRIETVIENAAPGRVRLPWDGRPWEFRGPGDRVKLLEEVRRVAKTDRTVDQDALAADLARQCGMQPVLSGSGPLDRKMSWEQARDLAADPLFIVAGHSHSHRTLAFLDDAGLEEEIGRSIDLLKERAGIASPHYCYPEGLAHCYDDRVVEALRRRGVRCSPTAIDGVNRRGSHPFHLKRIMVT
jgi:peptidoglycan/xylan/chitin deacetylase (PgdA/CDA1 family)